MSVTSSISTSEQGVAVRSAMLRRRATVCLLGLFSIVIILVGTAVLIDNSVPHDVAPGWTQKELRRRLADVEPRDIVIIGDSRVGWGVADRLVTTLLEQRGYHCRVRNLGVAGGGAREVLLSLGQQLLTERQIDRGVLVFAFSPAFAYAFSNGLGNQRGRVLNSVETALDTFFETFLVAAPSRLFEDIKWLWHPRHISFWKSRQTFPEGFVNGRLAWSDGRPIDLDTYQIEEYREILGRITSHKAESEARGQAIVSSLLRFQMAGWEVRFIRMPVGSEMRKLESELVPEFGFAALRDRVRVPAVDYTIDLRTASLLTLDQSHLAPQSARAFANLLAADFVGSVCANMRDQSLGAK
jgi:hypothetical protein